MLFLIAAEQHSIPVCGFKHFFFDLTGILLNYDRLLTMLHTPRVVTCQALSNIPKSEHYYSQYALTSVQYF